MFSYEENQTKSTNKLCGRNVKLIKVTTVLHIITT